MAVVFVCNYGFKIASSFISEMEASRRLLREAGKYVGKIKRKTFGEKETTKEK